LFCVVCDRYFPIVFDIPDLRVFPDPYIDLEADRAKGLELAARFDNSDFAGLVDFYYSTTAVVPPKHARKYTQGLLAGVARAEAALVSWSKVSGTTGNAANMKLLEVGCGTAPILVAAASSFKKLVGVDIAFRWLVVAKKRLADVGLDIPLICACAEALTTPNRHSIGPDPHTGMWAGSFMPSRLLSAYVRFIGGIPPVRRLLSANSLARLIRDAGFSLIGIELPNISEGQFKYQKRALRILIKLYQIATNLPICRQALKWIGPLLHATAQKPRPSSTISHP
jgi:hypothetical protein